MKSLIALRPTAVGLVVATILLIPLTLSAKHGRPDMFLPKPGQVAQHFLKQVKAHRFDAARDELSQRLQSRVSAQDLSARLKTREKAGEAIQEIDTNTQTDLIAGDSATATISLLYKNGRTQDIQCQLIREDGLWRLADLPI